MGCNFDNPEDLGRTLCLVFNQHYLHTILTGKNVSFASLFFPYKLRLWTFMELSFKFSNIVSNKLLLMENEKSCLDRSQNGAFVKQHNLTNN